MKKCKECGQPMLRKGQKRKHPDDYRHAFGCPNASTAEARKTEALWKRLGLIAVFVFIFPTLTLAQQPASYLYADIDFATARRLSLRAGIGGGFGGSFNLPHGFTLRDNFTALHQNKLGKSGEHSLSNVASLRYYVDLAPDATEDILLGRRQPPRRTISLFAEAGLQTATHTNLPSATRLQLGGGIDVINQTSWMPSLEVKVVGVKALKDIHGVNGVRLGIASYRNFKASPFGVFGEAESAYSRFHDAGATKSRGAFSGEFKVGLFINLTAIKGA